MSWIRMIDEREADGDLKKTYEDIAATRGKVANILKIHSVHPQVLPAHVALYRELMFGRSELSRTNRELIAVTVSSINHCHY